MLWIKAVAALESALLFTTSSNAPERPRVRSGHRSNDTVPPTPRQAVQRISGADDAALGADLLHAIDRAGRIAPGRGPTGHAHYPPPQVNHAIAADAARVRDRRAAPRATASPPVVTAPRPAPRPSAAPPATARTVWTHELVSAASNLTHTRWRKSRHTLGDDLWVSAGVAAWWGLREGLETRDAASLLHRARSLAYGLFETPGFARGQWADLGEDERRILSAWIRTRTALAGIAARNPPGYAATSLLMQTTESASLGPADPDMLETLYLLVMADNLARRYDMDTIRRQYETVWNPSLALAMSAYFRDLLLPDVVSLEDIAVLPADVQRGIDEAALLFFTVRDDAHRAWSVACPQNVASRAALRAAFLALLPEERQDRELVGELFRPTNVPGRIYYDDITLRHARGRTFDDLLRSDEMLDVPGMRDLTPARRRRILYRKFAQSHLSTRYPFASVRHAIATAVERAAYFREARIPDGLDTDVGLLTALKQARRTWNAADDGLVAPDLLLAGQLAATNELRLETMETLGQWFESTIVAPFRRVSDTLCTSEEVDVTPLAWLTQNMQRIRDSHLPRPATGLTREYAWAIDQIRQEHEKIASGGDAYPFVRPMPAVLYVSGAPPTPREFVKLKCYEFAFRGVDAAALQREILVGETWRERGQASLAYANERMFATFGPIPALDLSSLAVDTMSRAGLSASDIHAVRQIELESSNAALRERITGSFVDAFIRICQGVSATRHFFLADGQAIRPLEIVVPAIDAFNARLPSEPWIQLAALERFRRAGVVPSSARLREAIDEQVRQHRIPSITAILLEKVFDMRNLIPLYASSKAIVEGVTEKRYYQAMFGVIAMGGELSNVFRLNFGLGLPRSIYANAPVTAAPRRGSISWVGDGVSAFCGWPPALSNFQNLRPWQEFVTPPERLFEADLRLLPVHDRRPAPSLREDMLPWGAREPIARARAAGIDAWQGFAVVFCRNENATHLGRYETEDRYVKIDWLTLAPVMPPQFIQRDDTGAFHLIQTLLPPAPPFFGDSLLGDRPTVREVTAFLKTATDAAPRDFRTLFEAHFAIEYTSAARRFRQDHPSRGHDVLDELASAYARSDILRRVFHHFVDTTPPRDAIPVSVDCAVVPTTSVSRNPDGAVTTIHAIVLPADRDDPSLRYQSVRGIDQPDVTRAVLHEFLRAWTRLPDPAVPNQRHHRGGVVWLTEAVLRQMELPVYPRIAYGVWEERIAANSKMYQETILWSGLEDRLIEQLMPDLDLFAGVSRAYGMPTARRATVDQVLTLFAAAPTTIGAAPASLRMAELPSAFTFIDARPGTAAAHQTRFGTDVRDFLRHCEAHSTLLQKLLAVTPFGAAQVNATQPATAPWQFRLEGLTSTRNADVPQLYEVDFFKRRVTVLSGIAHYLSRGGLRPSRMEMRVLDATVALLVGETAASRRGSLYRDRGLVVWLTDHILEESGYDVAKRLNRAVLVEHHGTHYRGMLNEFARARWAAEVEDRYIGNALRGNVTGAIGASG